MTPGKLDTAASFDRIFGLYGHQFMVLIGSALVVFVPVGILSAIVRSSGSVFLAIAVAVISAIGQALYTGTVVEAVEDMRDGRRDFSVEQLLRAALPLVFPLNVTGMLYGIYVLV